jgi:hypothetical protein
VKSLKLLLGLVFAWILVGCTLQGTVPVTVIVLEPTATAPPIATPQPAPTATATPVLFPWADARAVMSGVCFEAALDASGQVLVFRSAEDHIRYYNQVDASGLCRRAVRREPFAFADGGRVLAGLWSYGRGCDAAHTVTDYALTDGRLTINLTFTTSGDCDYELLQPFWVAVPDVSDVQITVTAAAAP